ncbi:MAG: YozQ family protein [Bacillaceae bacterium]|nr:YozQ family protein [Bacillaceae bacterium]
MDQKKRGKESLAEKNDEPEDNQREDDLSRGLALTHEQASDTLTEGTIDGKIERSDGRDEEIPREGYEKRKQ